MKLDLQKCNLDNIIKVEFFKRDELTTDLLCCEILTSGTKCNETWFFHEESTQWENVLALVNQLPNFDTKWREKVVHPVFAENRTTAFIRQV